MLRRHGPVARQMLAKLIDGRLTFMPDIEQRLYRFSGTATLGNLLDGQVSENDAVGPWVWRARRDSNPRPTGSKPAALSN
jgi:hypothetical protein